MSDRLGRFSPVAGIQWVETPPIHIGKFYGIRVSVPLPGFSGLRPVPTIALSCVVLVFQSRCRDSVG